MKYRNNLNTFMPFGVTPVFEQVHKSNGSSRIMFYSIEQEVATTELPVIDSEVISFCILCKTSSSW